MRIRHKRYDILPEYEGEEDIPTKGFPYKVVQWGDISLPVPIIAQWMAFDRDGYIVFFVAEPWYNESEGEWEEPIIEDTMVASEEVEKIYQLAKEMYKGNEKGLEKVETHKEEGTLMTMFRCYYTIDPVSLMLVVPEPGPARDQLYYIG